jgi:capsular exopolysaccharide synthesis family protein
VDAAGAVEVLAVTSSVAGEGKTTTAANLAESFAAAGRRVLLVDADLRRTRLQRYLGLQGSTGLAGVLSGEVTLADAVQEWGPDGLRVLTGGAAAPNPSELLGSPAMEALVQQARHDYDLVVIDAPAVLSVTDASITAVLADGVLLQVRYGRTRRAQVEQALEALDVVNARVLGTVLSMTPNARGDKLPRAAGKSAAAHTWKS